MTKNELNSSLADLGIIEKIFLKNDEITDKNRVKIVNEGGYNYIYKDSELTEEEIKIAILVNQAKNVKSIKSMVLFFVILTIISLILSLSAIL